MGAVCGMLVRQGVETALCSAFLPAILGEPPAAIAGAAMAVAISVSAPHGLIRLHGRTAQQMGYG